MRRIIKPISGFLRKHPTLGRWALHLIPDVGREIRVESIGPLRIRLRRHRSYWLRDPLTHERQVIASLRQLIRPGDTVYDVGANIGLHLRFMLGPFKAGRIIAFEPMTENRALLEQNVRLSGAADRVTILPIALSDVNGTADLQIDDVRSGSAALSSITGGQASMGRRQYGLPPRTESVRIACLDDLASEQSLPPPQMMKIDIEGAEAAMLRGAQQLLARHHPRLSIEVHGLPVSRDVLAILDGLRYHCFGLVKLDGRDQYVKLSPTLIDQLTSRWDLQHVFASINEADVRDPAPEFH